MYRLAFELTALTDDTRLMLVDKSNANSSFPHKKTDSILMALGWHAWVRASAAGEYRVLLGVIVENDGTDGSVYFFDGDKFELTAAGTVQGAYRPLTVDRFQQGKSLNVVSGKIVGLEVDADFQDADNTAYQNDVALANVLGATAVNPAVGDLVIFVDEVSGTATFSVGVIFDYFE